MSLNKTIKDILNENENIRIPGLKNRDFDISTLIKKKPHKIITFTGFRRVGKTYLLFLIAKELRDDFFVYFNFEDERLPESTEVLTELIKAVEELYERRPSFFLFDEIHIIPGWGKFLRRLHDKGYKIFVTGSSSKLGLKEIPTELRGRSIHYELYPLSFFEFLHFKGIESTAEHTQQELKIKRAFREYLLFGGFPELYDSNEFDRKEILQEYYRTLVQRDLIERFDLKEDALLESTIKLLLNSLMISISKLTKTLQSIGYRCSKNTISNYISYLEKSYFLFQVLYHSKSVKNQMQHPRKIYFVDNGFIRFLSLSPGNSRLLENCVALELKRRGLEYFYWRSPKDEEVDFVIMEKGEVVELIQVCYDLSLIDTQERELRALNKAMKYFGLNHAKILAYDNEEKITLDKKEVEIIPAWKWLLERN